MTLQTLAVMAERAIMTIPEDEISMGRIITCLAIAGLLIIPMLIFRQRIVKIIVQVMLYTFLVLMALVAAMALLFVLSPSVAGRRAGFFIGIVLIIFAVTSLSFSIWQKNDYMKADEAIVMRPVTSVKSSPSGEASTDLFVLHEGTKVRLIDQVGSWSNIELADGRQGWMRTGDLETI